MGHENYLSLRRLKRASQAGLFATVEEDEQMAAIFDWVGETQNGTKGDLPFEPLPSVWEDVGRQKDLCLGKTVKPTALAIISKRENGGLVRIC